MGMHDSFTPPDRNDLRSPPHIPQAPPPPPAAPTSPAKSTGERLIRWVGLFVALAMIIVGSWLLYGWLFRGLAHSFAPGAAASPVAVQPPTSLRMQSVPAAPAASLRNSRLWQAVQADLNGEGISPRAERVVLPLVGNQGACVMWHQEIGPLGMIIQVAGSPDAGVGERGVPLNQPDLFLTRPSLAD